MTEAAADPNLLTRRDMQVASDSLTDITEKTLEHYSQRAVEYWERTRDHDVRQNIEALLRHVSGTPPFSILDFGCGPGRDLAAFRALGHTPIGLEGSGPLAALARENSGCEVWEQNFLSLTLPAGSFDGVFANASLFHVPGLALSRVLRELADALKPEGVLFASNPRGNNEEGWHGARYGVYHDIETWRGFLCGAGFVELEHYYRPQGVPQHEQTWLASVWRKREML